MSEPTLQAIGVSKWFGDVVALTNVSLRVAPGVTGLLGPNGAGKSTLFKCLTGISAPSSGSVTLLGRDPRADSSIFRDVGLCPDVDKFFEEMSGLDFVAALARLHGMPRDEARRAAERALDRVGLADVMRKRVAAMSKGMRQRVKFAQAIVHDPHVVLLDEPLNGMDPLARHATVELIGRLGAEGRTVVVSSHILHEVDAMSQQVVLLVQGRVLAEGSVREIRDAIRTKPHRVAVGTPDARRLAREMLAIDGVRGVIVEAADRVLVDTTRPADLLTWITGGAADGRVRVDELGIVDESLEAVFEMLVG
ncbi:MAG TPA: ABC transporter ATP-binding protein [Planctomycetota bacterium]|nr:ABC transporter ATP-binding protein [Planctomycetota bacterium]